MVCRVRPIPVSMPGTDCSGLFRIVPGVCSTLFPLLNPYI